MAAKFAVGKQFLQQPAEGSVNYSSIKAETTVIPLMVRIFEVTSCFEIYTYLTNTMETLHTEYPKENPIIDIVQKIVW